MRIVFKLFAFLVVLCALAGAGWGGYWLYRHYARPGGSGRNMEVRLLARHGVDALTDATSTVDILPEGDVRAYVASGNAPSGWRWLPVANGVEREVTGDAQAGSDNEYVSRTSNGQMFLLAADQPDMTLTHASDIRAWGVDSVRVENYRDSRGRDPSGPGGRRPDARFHPEVPEAQDCRSRRRPDLRSRLDPKPREERDRSQAPRRPASRSRKLRDSLMK